jgi:Cysteine-rich CWC
MGGAEPCICTGVTLDAALQQRLRERFSGCLCLRCLQALARGATLDAPARPVQP